MRGNLLFITGLNEDSKASLYDINGKKLMRISNGENDVSMLSSGIYFLIMKNTQNNLTKRIIIQ